MRNESYSKEDWASTMHLKQPQLGTNATMRNHTPFLMTRQRFYNWSGSPAGGSFPATIMPGDSEHFTHLKDGAFGSKGAVVYTGMNGPGFPCAWLLSWDAPANSSSDYPNRVHVACGAQFMIDDITESKILGDLSIAINIAQFTETSTKTNVNANISEDIPNVATLSAEFKIFQ